MFKEILTLKYIMVLNFALLFHFDNQLKDKSESEEP